jgi:two-component system, OmpR family, sensor histidine kinase BaeS
MTKSLFGRTFLVMLLSHAAVVIILSGVFVFAVQRSIDRWNTDRGAQVKNIMIPEIVQVRRQSGRLSEGMIHQALEPFLTDSVSVLATNAARDPVYLYLKGRQISIHQPEELAEGIQEMREMEIQPATLLDGTEVIGTIYIDTTSFRDDLTNRRLINSLFSIVTGGALASLIGALIVAYLLSRLLVKQAQLVSTGIGRLAAGHRDVTFPERGPRELQVIARSALSLQQQLAREENLRKQWMEDIAHDLRTPITALKTQFEGMTDGYISVTPERLKDLSVELEHVERLVTDLRELSWVESPEMRLEIFPISTTVFLKNLESLFRSRADGKGIPFHVEADEGFLSMDHHLMQRALANILENAFNYVAAGGSVFLGASSKGDRWILEVRNSGNIDRQEMEHVFERFYRGKNAVGTTGSGLGLSVASAIIEAHQGSIGMVQERGETVVRIILPT